MAKGLCQGDVLMVEHMKYPVLVVSKDYFNSSGEIIGCPIYDRSAEGPLHILVNIGNRKGYVQCEKLALLDMSVRGYKTVEHISMRDRIEISDVIQGIFEYV